MDSKGYTMLEILLATAILGVVFSMVGLALSGSVRVVDATERHEEIARQAQKAMQRLTEDLAGVMVVKEVSFAGVKGQADDQRADSLLFASSAHLVFNPEFQRQGLAVIRYRLEPERDNPRMLRLLRSDTLYAPGGETDEDEWDKAPFVLADGLRSLEIRYFNSKGQEFDSWGEEQDPQAEEKATRPLPAAVEATLEFWLDLEKERSVRFIAATVMPTGLVVPEKSHGQ